ncbi:MAG: hypothetical protein ACKN9H_04795, partial [Methylophilaceae bacterium]
SGHCEALAMLTVGTRDVSGSGRTGREPTLIGSALREGVRLHIKNAQHIHIAIFLRCNMTPPQIETRLA